MSCLLLACGNQANFVPLNSVLENFPGGAVSGSIPTELGLLSNLKKLYGRQQTLGGFIPTQLGNTKLYDVNLNGNSIIGSIPSELGRLDLVGFEVQGSQLDGAIPSQIFKSTLQNM